MQHQNFPVLAIDGPGGAGKGVVSRAIARHKGWHFLDSGAIYRSLAIAVLRAGLDPDNEAAIASLASEIDLTFGADEPPGIYLSGEDISELISSETCGATASRIAALGPVRKALLGKQHEFRKAPGLVADGRDMGTVVFPDAEFKIFLTASVEVRAERRYNQLKEKGIAVNLVDLTRNIEERDRRDRERAEAPLVQAEQATLIDSSDMTIEQVIDRILVIVDG